MNRSKKQVFRGSKVWKDFRALKKEKDKVDAITLKPLYKGFHLHHIDMSEENYDKIEQEDNFVCLNKQSHDCIHFLFRYYVKDKLILERIKDILDKMEEKL